MKPNQTLVCPECGYNANPNTATHCRVCNHVLDSTKVSTRNSSAIPWSAVPLIGLLLLTGGLFFNWRYRTVYPPTQAGKPSSQVAATPSKQPQQVSANKAGASDLKLYNTMAEVENVPQGLFNYAGAVTFANLTAHGMNSAIALAHSKFQLRYTDAINKKPGSGTAIAMLIDSQVSFAQSARPLNDAEYGQAKVRGLTLQQVPVFIDAIAFYTHPGVSIAGVSLDQVQAIFTGKVTNWKQVGGPDLPIKPFSQDPKASSVISLLLDGQKDNSLGRNVQIIYSITDAIRKVGSTPGGISYSSPSLAINQKTIRPLGLAKAGSKQYVQFFTDGNRINTQAFRDGTYPLLRRLFVVFRRDGTLDQQAGVAYTNMLLSNEGQQLIEKAGFVPLRY